MQETRPDPLCSPDRLDEAEKAIEESEWQRMHDEAEQGKGAKDGPW
jgi:hypothetical protein